MEQSSKGLWIGPMAFPLIMSALTEGAGGYAMQQIKIGHSKGRPGSPVACRICGAYGRVTLYKDAGGRICKECHSKALEADS